MIIDAILDFILFVPNFLLDNLNFIGNINIPPDIVDWWKSTLSLLAYVFPISSLLPIFIISFAMKAFQISWSLINKLKGWIPTMSD